VVGCRRKPFVARGCNRIPADFAPRVARRTKGAGTQASGNNGGHDPPDVRRRFDRDGQATKKELILVLRKTLNRWHLGLLGQIFYFSCPRFVVVYFPNPPRRTQSVPEIWPHQHPEAAREKHRPPPSRRLHQHSLLQGPFAVCGPMRSRADAFCSLQCAASAPPQKA